MNTDSIMNDLRTNGQRMTVARRAIIRAFGASVSPLTAVSLHSMLKKKHPSLNKTTVYREIKFLESRGVLRSLQFDERNRRYELTPSEHRHHLICTSCKKIDDVVLDHDLDEVEKALVTRTAFKVQRHALEFYGVCGECQD